MSGHSGQFVVGADEVIVRDGLAIHDPGPAGGLRWPTSTRSGTTCPGRWPRLLASVGARRVAVEAASITHALWLRLEAASPDVELVPVEGWVEALRAEKQPDEIERIAAACAVADRALAALLPEIRAGMTEADLALRLEWLIRERRRGGARVRRRVPLRARGRAASTARRASARFDATPCCCSTSAPRSRATAAT